MSVENLNASIMNPNESSVSSSFDNVKTENKSSIVDSSDSILLSNNESKPCNSEENCNEESADKSDLSEKKLCEENSNEASADKSDSSEEKPREENSNEESANKSDLPEEKPCEENEWMDIMGSGTFMKLIIKKGCGHETRPGKGDQVLICLHYFVNDSLIEQHENLQFIVGDMDVIQGIDLVICLMEKDEVAKVKIPAKLAFGKIGRSPDIPPDCDLECEIHLKDVQTIDHASLSISQRLQLGDEKRARGNFFYERAEYLDAIFCYERSAEYLEGVQDSSGSTTAESQKIVDMIVKIHNNLAASHLKLSAYQAALKSVEYVLNVQPRNVKALFRKAKILGAQGSTDEAIRCLKNAINIEPDTKVLHSELIKLKNQKIKEEQSQRAMYKRMFPQNEKQPKRKSSFSKVLKIGAVTAGMAAVVAGMVAFKYFHS